MSMKLKEQNITTDVCYAQKIARNRYLPIFLFCDNIIIYHDWTQFLLKFISITEHLAQ
jgi:hypothetical protein